MITPTPGRIVWYREPQDRNLHTIGDQPLAAIVTHVHGDRLINVALFLANGTTVPRKGVTLLQDGDEPDGLHFWCEWMPYQKGQAARQDEAGRVIERLAKDGPPLPIGAPLPQDRAEAKP